MAVDMFLKIDGVAGEAQDKTHKEEIDVLAWSWGASNSGTTHMGSGSGGGKANVQDLSVTKYVDSSSARLLQACVTGEHFASANLVCRKAGKTPLEYIKLDLTDVIVTSVSTGGSGGEDRLTENVTLNFGHLHHQYIPQKLDGTGDAAKEFKYDIAANTEE